MRLIDVVRRARDARDEARHASFNGQLLQFSQSWSSQPEERLAHSFVTYVQDGYQANGVVFAVTLARLMLFSEARFLWRSLESGRPGELSWDKSLEVIDRPWPKARTSDLLVRMEQDVTLAGNFYGWHDLARRRIQRLRPDWVDIIIGLADSDVAPDAAAADALGAEILGYLYTPGGQRDFKKSELLMPEEIIHYAPTPDPLATARGMSWLTPVAREIDADSAMTRHKSKFFENAATPNLVITVPAQDKEKGPMPPSVRERLLGVLRSRHEGVENAWKTLLLEHGADVKAVGSSFKESLFDSLQAAGENRIAAAGGVPGIVVGLKEGLDAATYSNYQQAMRRFADITMRPNWRNAAGAIEDVLRRPANAELWYLADDIPALAADAKDKAETDKLRAETMGSLIRSGYEADSVTAAVLSGDYTQLKHTGGLPVTLYPDGQEPTAA